MHPIHRSRHIAHCLVVALAGILVTSCSDNRKMSAQINALKTREVELTTESEAVSAELGEINKKIKEVERGQRDLQREASVAEIKTRQLKTKLDYLQAATKAANEQSDVLNAETTKYKIKYLSK
jgi:predicted nuclease with TOPRIM domain